MQWLLGRRNLLRINFHPQSACNDGAYSAVFELGRGSRNGAPMALFWQINPEEMLSGLMVAMFIILLNAAIVVVCSLATFPLIDLAFKKKAKPALWHHDGLTAHDPQLSGPPWLAMRSKFLRPAAVPHSQLVFYPTAQECAVERITPLIARLLVPKGSEGAPPVTALPTLLTSSRKAA